MQLEQIKDHPRRDNRISANVQRLGQGSTDIGLSNRLIKSHMDGKVESPNYVTTVSGRRQRDNELSNSTYSRRSASEARDMENI